MDSGLQGSELYESQFGFKEERKNFRFYIFLLCLFFFLVGLRGWWVNNFGGVIVDGTSMNQTLKDGDKLLMKYVKDVEELEYGDVIVVYVGDYEECNGISSGYLIKRLIAKEHDKVRCVNGQIEIWYDGADGYVPLDEPYAYYTDKAGYDFDEYVVEEGEIFFLGDNRNHSCDSRYYQYPSGSHLEDGLYKATDVSGVVPEWAVKYKGILEKIFF